MHDPVEHTRNEHVVRVITALRLWARMRMASAPVSVFGDTGATRAGMQSPAANLSN